MVEDESGDPSTTRRVLLLGSTGRLGSAVLAELIARGHEVVAAVRPGGGAPSAPGGGELTVVEVEPRDPGSVAAAAADVDVLVSAIGGRATGDFSVVADIARPLLEAASAAGVDRLLVIGGAGSLLEADGTRRVDSPDFPDAWKRSSLPQAEALEVYRADTSGVDWVYLSPSDLIDDAGPTGNVEVGGDQILRGADGSSSVTSGDLAAVLVDEIERPSAHRRRITARTR